MATLTGRTARSTSPSCDTPGVNPMNPDSLDGLPRTAAEAAWRVVVASIAGTPHVRISKDGGRTYPARHARPLPAAPPGQPCTVPVFDPGEGTGCMLALDLAPGRAGRDVDDATVPHRHERGTGCTAEVRAQAEALAELVFRCGGQVLADVSPSGGRHVPGPVTGRRAASLSGAGPAKMLRVPVCLQHLESCKPQRCRRPALGGPHTTPEHPLVRASRTGCQPKPRAEPKAATVATLTGRTARSTSPSCDTPGVV